MRATPFETAGGAGTKIVIPILKVIGIHIKLAIVGIPVRIDKTGARPTSTLRCPYFRGNNALCIRDPIPNAKLLFLFIITAIENNTSQQDLTLLRLSLVFLERFDTPTT